MRSQEGGAAVVEGDSCRTIETRARSVVCRRTEYGRGVLRLRTFCDWTARPPLRSNFIASARCPRTSAFSNALSYPDTRSDIQHKLNNERTGRRYWRQTQNGTREAALTQAGSDLPPAVEPDENIDDDRAGPPLIYVACIACRIIGEGAVVHEEATVIQ